MTTTDGTLVIAGRLASGKTTTAAALAAHDQNREVLTVSDVIRSIAESRGKDPGDRAALQQVGYDLISEGPREFASEILTRGHSDKLLIVDGLRSPAVVAEIRKMSTQMTAVVFLELSEAERALRYENRRAGTNQSSFREVDSHPIELMADGISEDADLLVDSTQPLTHVCAVIEAYLTSSMHLSV